MATYLKLITLLVVASVQAVDNCFFDNHLDFVYTLPDPSGNYTSVKEYWMRKETICDFSLDTNNKLTWYSSDISVYYLLYWDKEDGEGCRANPTDEMTPYTQGWPWEMGTTDPTGFNEGVLCLVKYLVDNDNTYHDLRIQIFKIGDASDFEEEAAFGKLYASVFALASLLMWLV